MDKKMSEKIDFKKTFKTLYNPPKEMFQIVDVPQMNYLMIDGKGNPNTSELYQQSVEVLYTMSYGIKFALKAQGFDHVIPPLEGLWWMLNMNDFTRENKELWEWTMMIMQPEWVSNESVEKTRHEVYRKKKLPLLDKVRFEGNCEGLSVQIMYTGAYDNEASTIAHMHSFIKDNGYEFNGKHHEIYLGDPRKTLPEKLQTILRQPIRKA
jgi:hypothetical protein